MSEVSGCGKRHARWEGIEVAQLLLASIFFAVFVTAQYRYGCAVYCVCTWREELYTPCATANVRTMIRTIMAKGMQDQ
jgi:hypothetical protein